MSKMTERKVKADWSQAGKSQLDSVTACILAGGLGTRLRSVLPNTPKAIAPIDGSPFILRLLEKLSASGIKRTVLCTGYLAHQIEEQIGSSFQGMEMAYSEEAKPMGTAGAIKLSLPYWNTQKVLILNGDSYCDVDLGSFIHWHSAKSSQASLVLAKVQDRSRFGSITLGPNASITSFVEKGSALGPGWINAGVYLLDRSIIEAIPSGLELSLEKNVFPNLVDHGLYGFQMEAGGFIDIGTPDSYAKAREFFAERGHP